MLVTGLDELPNRIQNSLWNQCAEGGLLLRKEVVFRSGTDLLFPHHSCAFRNAIPQYFCLLWLLFIRSNYTVVTSSWWFSGSDIILIFSMFLASQIVSSDFPYFRRFFTIRSYEYDITAKNCLSCVRELDLFCRPNGASRFANESCREWETL